MQYCKENILYCCTDDVCSSFRYLMQYGKHALDMLASSQDSLRLVWLEQLFSSAADSERQEDIEEGIGLKTAIKLIQSVNPGVSSSKVEHRFKELQRLRERTCGLTLDNGSRVKDCSENKRLIERNEQVTKMEFIEVFHDFCTRPEIYFLLVQFSSNKEFLDTKDLMRFLEAEQGMAQVSNTNESCIQVTENKSALHSQCSPSLSALCPISLISLNPLLSLCPTGE